MRPTFSNQRARRRARGVTRPRRAIRSSRWVTPSGRPNLVHWTPPRTSRDMSRRSAATLRRQHSWPIQIEVVRGLVIVALAAWSILVALPAVLEFAAAAIR